MPVYTLDVTGDGTGAATDYAIQTGEGNILTACAFVKDGSTVSGNTQIEIGISATAGNPEMKTAILINDYVYDTFSPGWDGNIPVEAGQGIVVTLRSFDTATIRCNFTWANHPV